MKINYFDDAALIQQQAEMYKNKNLKTPNGP